MDFSELLFGPAIAFTALSLAIVIKFDERHIRGVHFLIGDYRCRSGRSPAWRSPAGRLTSPCDGGCGCDR
jgi:hypothetical protein